MMAPSLLCILLSLLAVAESRSIKYNTTRRRSDALVNYWLIPHTHDDLGWIITPDEAFSGVGNALYHANVRFIIDSIMVALQQNPDRKMIYCEMGFLSRWWREQEQATKDVTLSLLSSGQLQLIQGAWAQTDEASPSYLEMIDGTSLGHRWIIENLGEAHLPNVTWSIDPFGHSATNGGLLSSPQAGFGGVYWARLSPDDRARRVAGKAMEFVWRPSTSTGDALLTYGMAQRIHYSAPNGFSFDSREDHVDKIVDDARLDTYNIKRRVDDFVTLMQGTYGNAYLGNDVLVPFGDDCMYENAPEYFSQLDKLIHYVNLDGRINVLYGTPAEYLTAKLQDPTVVLPVNEFDFFPLEDGQDTQWTGYFTSRVALKAYIRESSALHHTSRQVLLISGAEVPTELENGPLFALDEAIATTMHHDAITGTEFDAVASSYEMHMARGRRAALDIVASAISNMTGYGTAGSWAACEYTNVTICPPLESPTAGESVVMTAWNPRSYVDSIHVRVPVSLPSGVGSYAVLASDGVTPITAQLLPPTAEDLYLRGVYRSDAAAPMQWLAFVTPPVPAIGYAAFFITPVSSSGAAPSTHFSTVTVLGGSGGSSLRGYDGEAGGVLTNGIISLTFDAATGAITQYSNPSLGLGAVPFTSQMVWYNGSDSTNYMFGPQKEGNSWLPAMPLPPDVVTFVTGPVVNEARQVLSQSYVNVTVRLWANDSTGMTFEYTAGPLPCHDFNSREIVARYNVSEWDTNGRFATDSNCREMQPRVRDKRPTFNSSYSPIAGNYYPVSCGIRTSDVQTGATLIVSPDRPLGAASLGDGSIETMVHRRIIHSGMIWLNETGQTGAGLIVRGTQSVAIVPAGSVAAVSARFTSEHLFRPLSLFASTTFTPSAWAIRFHNSFRGLASPLPANVELVTAQALSATTALLRLAHRYEYDAPAALSANATVALGPLFGRTVVAVQEQTTIGSRALATAPKWSYRMQGRTDPVVMPVVPPTPIAPDWAVTLSTMQVRTFLVTYSD